ncbi:MAG: D-alanyl-D-alanine carboxypeptidase/D-alanyl-D-alanine-endopeptidase [Prevotella sp.]|nr:D-alanyl-D-alanine carboxypeptidase/D-alanyl-D-alanine-endopeptidase [Prevotella sp.]
MRRQHILSLLFLAFSFVLHAQEVVFTDNMQRQGDAYQGWYEGTRYRLEELMGDKLLGHTQLGLMVYDLTTNQTVFVHNEYHRQRPASVMKLVTSITALDMLGGDYGYQTSICYSGQLVGDTLRGDLYCVGGFDPTITRSDLRSFADSIRRFGIRHIVGRVVADVSMKDTMAYGSGWCWDDDNSRLTPLLVDKKDQFVSALMGEMRSSGIQLDVTTAKGRRPQRCTEIYRYRSSIDKVLYRMMKESDNLYAESMFYQIAKASSPQTATAADASGAMKRLVYRMGLDPLDYTFADGSGLSHYSYVSAELIVRLLRHAYDNREIYDHLYPTLPIAGVDGTLEKRMTSGVCRGNVHAKTGTVTGVSTLGGFCQASNGHTLCFAILNQGLVKASDGRAFQDKVCEAICK